ncbi:MAG TPA: acetamidase/formamidase family protein [Bryobacteraceae bacterium]|nr:acetamidase/formamidase family protein [Bryobacteraceae bacterium]
MNLSHRCRMSGFAALVWICLAYPAPAQHVLRVTPSTVQWGYFAEGKKPALTVKSGETVTMDTIVGIPDMLEELGATTDDSIREMKEMYAKVTDKGPGPHFLTGPIAIEGALPGDVLEVEILEIRLRSPYGWMMIEPGAGILPGEFPYLRKKLVPLDQRNMVAEFAPGVRLPVRPFFGNLGVAPPMGRIGSSAPGFHAGNLDNKWLVAGTKLFIPVQVPGALFAAGDGHASQGDGEVCVTAVETNLTGVFRFTVRKDMKLRWPRAETPTHIIAMGLNEDLDEAARHATTEMIDYLTSERGLSRDDAYMLTSAAVDLHVTQVVDGVKGVHAMLAKSIFGAEPALKALVVDGQNNHAWRETTPVLKQLLEQTGLFRVSVATAPAKGGDMTAFKPDFAAYNVVVLNYTGDPWTAATNAAFEKYVREGGGVVIFHAANNAFPDWKEFNEMIAVGGWENRTTEKSGPMIRFRDGKVTTDSKPGRCGSHGARLPFQVAMRDRSHPITNGLPEVWMHAADELYDSLCGPAKNVEVLATAHSDPANRGTGENEPMLMTIRYGKGRVFHTALGHDPAAMQCAGFMTTLQRGAEWAATGKVTQKAPADFPTAEQVSLRK